MSFDHANITATSCLAITVSNRQGKPCRGGRGRFLAHRDMPDQKTHKMRHPSPPSGTIVYE